ncbi:MAG TPA: hypothetical protein VK548_01115 [Candidatus Acidoferrum sp.]|nr:hypothetical protein [Candidatus Acidoferrum sp.]
MSTQFEAYLTAAVKAALRHAARDEDGGVLWGTNEVCRRGVQRSWDRLGERAFLKQFLWVVGAIQKPYETRIKYYPRQVKLFRGCVSQVIRRDQTLIRQEWQSKKRDLNSRMVAAMLEVSCRVASEGWETFKRATLPLPRNPESEDPADWRGTYVALDAPR